MNGDSRGSTAAFGSGLWGRGLWYHLRLLWGFWVADAMMLRGEVMRLMNGVEKVLIWGYECAEVVMLWGWGCYDVPKVTMLFLGLENMIWGCWVAEVMVSLGLSWWSFGKYGWLSGIVLFFASFGRSLWFPWMGSGLRLCFRVSGQLEGFWGVN